MRGRCFFAGWPDAGPCDGALIRAHLVPRQLLKRDFPWGVVLAEDGRWYRRFRGESRPEASRFRSLKALCDDPRSFVACCGGPMGPGGHHGMLDQSRTLRIPREQLPAAVEEFAAELGLVWWLDREYGPRRPFCPVCDLNVNACTCELAAVAPGNHMRREPHG